MAQTTVSCDGSCMCPFVQKYVMQSENVAKQSFNPGFNGDKKLFEFNLGSFEHLGLPGSKHLCDLAQLGATHEAEKHSRLIKKELLFRVTSQARK